MKKSTLLFSLIIISSLFLLSCTKDKPMNPNTPVNASIMIKNYIDAENYEGFIDLFSDELKNSISRDDFKKFKDISTSGSSHSLYDIITFENGEMLLIKLSSVEIDGKYKVEEVLQIPKEFKSLFNQE